MTLEFRIEVIKNERHGVDYLATQEGFTRETKLTGIIVIGVGDNGRERKS